MNTWFDLTKPEISYLFGFLQADGHLAGSPSHKGKLQVEIQASDAPLLYRIAPLFPTPPTIRKRTRNTNFKMNSESAVLTICDMQVRDTLNTFGLPYGKKSLLVAPPSVPYSAPDYYRGFLDGDGAIGLTSQGIPFVSWVTTSPKFAEGLLAFIFESIGQCKTTTPNKRDNAYNIVVFKEQAQALARILYSDGCIALERKRLKALEVLAWERPAGMMKVTWKKQKWTPEEDTFIKVHSVEDSIRQLNRTEKSIKVRLWRLTGKCDPEGI